jgi:hypothetical protein
MDNASVIPAFAGDGVGEIDQACPKNERPGKLRRNTSKLADSFDKGCDKVCDEDEMGRFWDKL